jgi:hypothetical protein
MIYIRDGNVTIGGAAIGVCLRQGRTHIEEIVVAVDTSGLCYLRHEWMLSCKNKAEPLGAMYSAGAVVVTYLLRDYP